MKESYLHLLNLDTVGGVEELYIHFLENAHTLSSAKQHLLVTGDKPHPFFKERIERLAATVTLEKWAAGIKIPPSLRFLQRKRALSKSAPDKVILWNRLEPLTTLKNQHVVYYEHGASWIERQTEETKCFFNNVDQILANSHAAKRVLELKWGTTLPITVIENPLKPTLSTSEQPKKAPKRGCRLGYIGRLIPLKGVSLILHALKALGNEYELVIAGDGSEQPKLLQEAKRLNLEKRVSFLGCIQDVASFYDSIDLLIVPSIREPLGLVAQEAALRGVPVIASCIDGLPEVVINGSTGCTISPELSLDAYEAFGGRNERLPDLVYDPKKDRLITPRLVNPVTVATTIDTLMQDPVRYESMSKNAIQFAKSRPTFTTYTETLLNYLI